MIRNILRDILATYGSLSQPNWSFLWQGAKPYCDVIETIHSNISLLDGFSVTDMSDYMYGLGPQLVFHCEEDSWWLSLSLVGRYAYFGKTSTKPIRIIESIEHCETDFEHMIISALDKHSIALVPKIIAQIELPEFHLWLEPEEGEIPTIQNVLFFYS